MKLRITVPEWATHIVSDLTDMGRNPHPVEASRVSSFTLDLPDDVYFEYAFVDDAGKLRADPERAERADNPWYGEVSAVYGPDYLADPYATPGEVTAGEAVGEIVGETVGETVGESAREKVGKTQRGRLESSALDQTRRFSIYTPKGYENEALPVVYVQDGVALYRYARLHLVLETLLRDNLVRPAHLVFLEPTDRTKEYGFNEAYRRFVLEEALPEVERRVAVTGERVALGASLGGLVSMLLALDAPERFRSVAAFSGAFLGTPEARDFYRAKDSWVLEELKRRERLPLRLYTETGTLEWLTHVNRELTQVLDAKGYDHRYRERHAGHNWTNWKNGFREALSFVLEP